MIQLTCILLIFTLCMVMGVIEQRELDAKAKAGEKDDE
jgi:signal transduction histidine kinase